MKRDTLFGPISGLQRGCIGPPGPGAHNPLKQKKSKPAFAGFNSSSKRGFGLPDNADSGAPKLETEMLGHSDLPMKTNSSNFQSFDTTRPRTTSAHFTQNLGVPGVGAYDLAKDFVRPSTSARGGARPTTAQMHPALQALRSLKQQRNPPSVPSKLDYGYEVVDGRQLVPQPPPPEIAPRVAPPGPTAYTPSVALTRPHSAAATARYASDRTARVGFESFFDRTVPGPGAYLLPTGAAVSAKPSDRLQSAVFASRCRKGVAAIVSRPATGTRVGPGTHYNAALETGFPGRGGADHDFGARRPRFTGPLPSALIKGPPEGNPGPGEYTRPGVIDIAVKRAQEEDWRLKQLWERRAAAQEHAAAGSPSRGPEGGPRRASADAAIEKLPTVTRLPAAAFASTLPRFAPPNNLETPAPTAYFVEQGDQLGSSQLRPASSLRRAVSASASTRRGTSRRDPRSILASDSGTQIILMGAGAPDDYIAAEAAAFAPHAAVDSAAFGSTAPRFHRRGVHDPVAGERLDIPGVGPDSYDARPRPSMRTQAAAAAPSFFFRDGSSAASAAAATAAASESMPSRSAATSAAAESTALLAVVDTADVRLPPTRPSFSRSAAQGRFAELSPERKPFPLDSREVMKQSRLPGPATYDLSATSMVPHLQQQAPASPRSQLNGADALQGRATLPRSPHKPMTAASRPSTASTGVSGVCRPTAIPHQLGGAVALALTEPRFRESRSSSPAPTAYNPRPAADGATKRTFNVALASNEARAILFRQHILSGGQQGQ